MSLVGTRPPTVDEWEQYELHHRSRMSIKPGITGMWQASGRSDITDFEEVVRLDEKLKINRDKMVSLEIFDYLIENYDSHLLDERDLNKKSPVIIAGALSRHKVYEEF